MAFPPKTVQMDPEKLLKIVRSYLPLCSSPDTLLLRVPVVGPDLPAFLRIPCWTYIDLGLDCKQRQDWAIPDAFDALAVRYGSPRTLEEVRDMVSLPVLEDGDVFLGSNGSVANGRRPGK